MILPNRQKQTKAADAPNASTSPVVDEFMAGIQADDERRWSRPPLSRKRYAGNLAYLLMPGGDLKRCSNCRIQREFSF